MAKYRYTEYFENEVLRKRPYLRKEWCVRVLEKPIRVEPQEHNRYRFWGAIDELEGCFSRQGVQTMKLKYYPDTDSLYIDLSSKPSVDSRVISEGVVLDYDEEGNIVGFDIDNASRKIDLKEITISKIPAQLHAVSA